MIEYQCQAGKVQSRREEGREVGLMAPSDAGGVSKKCKKASKHKAIHR